MRFNSPVLLNAVAATANANGPAAAVESAFGGSVQVVSTTGAAGAVKLQGSNDPVTPGRDPTNWTDITGATVTVSGANSYLIDGLTIQYNHLRAVWTNSTSTGGTVTARGKFNGF